MYDKASLEARILNDRADANFKANLPKLEKKLSAKLEKFKKNAASDLRKLYDKFSLEARILSNQAAAIYKVEQQKLLMLRDRLQNNAATNIHKFSDKASWKAEILSDRAANNIKNNLPHIKDDLTASLKTLSKKVKENAFDFGKWMVKISYNLKLKRDVSNGLRTRQ